MPQTRRWPNSITRPRFRFRYDLVREVLLLSLPPNLCPGIQPAPVLSPTGG
jgi:hypothetical protein